jgi:23S rRNA pseudouridine2605 synthase
LQKFLAEAGVASRRAAEQLMLDGRVSVNGNVVRELGTKVDPAHDLVVFDGQPVRPRRKLYLALNKPPGYLCTRSDEARRRTVFNLLPAEWGHLNTVGRLDRESEGLIFLTNDGEFSLRLTHPRFGTKKLYRVTVMGRVEASILQRIEKGVVCGGELLKAESARLLDTNNTRSVVDVVLSEGKNREIRRLFESQNILVERLERLQIGPIKLGELRPGKWRTLTETEIKSLLAQR